MKIFHSSIKPNRLLKINIKSWIQEYFLDISLIISSCRALISNKEGFGKVEIELKDLLDSERTLYMAQGVPKNVPVFAILEGK